MSEQRRISLLVVSLCLILIAFPIRAEAADEYFESAFGGDYCFPEVDETIVDNAEATFVCNWETFTEVPAAYNGDYRAYAGTGICTATWTPSIISPGTYNVYAWWVDGPDRATDATYTIFWDGGSSVFTVNQQINGGQWNWLGKFEFDGTGDYVQLVSNADGKVIADAVKFIYEGTEPTPEIIMDNSDATYTGNWTCESGVPTCVDDDGDGYGVCPDCGTAEGCTYDGDDCNDVDAAIHPAATEVCDGADNDCDGLIDEGDRDGDQVPDCTDSCPDENATGFDANGDGCIDNVGGLEQLVQTLVAEGVIDGQLQNSLLSKIGNAQKSTDKENICAAVNQLVALKNEVNAQRDKKISNEAADLVIAYANNVIATLLAKLPTGVTC
jgi:Putative metal-binding motif/FIMAH domain